MIEEILKNYTRGNFDIKTSSKTQTDKSVKTLSTISRKIYE